MFRAKVKLLPHCAQKFFFKIQDSKCDFRDVSDYFVSAAKKQIMG